jgi:hypothetical protein
VGRVSHVPAHCASLLLARGASAVQVQRWLGHHSPAFTLDTYVHLLPGDSAPPLRLDQEILPPRSEIESFLGMTNRINAAAEASDRSASARATVAPS